MPAYAIGMADRYEGPIEDPELARHRDARASPATPTCRSGSSREVMHDVDVAYAEEWKFDHGIMVPLHFLTPRFDLPVIPVNINCQGPPLTPLHARLGVRRGAAARLRRGARADRAGRHRRHLALAGDARLRQDQRGVGPRLPRPLGAQRPRRRCSTTPTPRPTATPARAASRSAPSSPSPPRRAARARSATTQPIPIFSVGCTVGDDGDRIR